MPTENDNREREAHLIRAVRYYWLKLRRQPPRFFIGAGVIFLCLQLLLPPSSSRMLWFVRAHGLIAGVLLLAIGLYRLLAYYEDVNDSRL